MPIAHPRYCRVFTSICTAYKCYLLVVTNHFANWAVAQRNPNVRARPSPGLIRRSLSYRFICKVETRSFHFVEDKRAENILFRNATNPYDYWRSPPHISLEIRSTTLSGCKTIFASSIHPSIHPSSAEWECTCSWPQVSNERSMESRWASVRQGQRGNNLSVFGTEYGVHR